MATLTALPYSYKHYDSLPDIMDAANALASTGIIHTLASSIGEIFIKYGVENTFGLTLLHRHFDMEAHEILVGFGNVSVPWDVTSNKAEMHRITPISWRYTADGIVPYEFSGDETMSLPSDKSYDAFVEELGNSLRNLQVDQLFGLCHVGNSNIQSAGTMEFTSGRANVTVPNLMWNLQTDSAAVEAAWQFGKQGEAT